MLTIAINNQTVVLRQSGEEIRGLRLAVQQLNATIARRSHSSGSEEQGVVLLQDEHVARPGTESQGVADSELPPMDPPSQLDTLPTSSHAPTDPNTQTHHSDPSHHIASPCSHSSNMPPPDQPTSTRIAPTSTPLFSLPSATHTSRHAQPDLSPYSTFTTPLPESPNPQIRSHLPAQNVIPSTLPLFSLPINLAPQSFTHLPGFTFSLLPQSTSHTFPTPQAQPLSSNPLQQIAIQLPQQQQMAMLLQQQQEQMALLLQQQQEQMAMLREPRQEH
ncbi:probable serine/threonine-protein kinase samkC [Rana temporaria]|uniref:probable serine/threonine-protein kinase samkC n=1 Tax=Rana temporaria TaxID=8407 RepID=UPI001AAC77C8|nr:probable serine/threonine-protein kinase samkC [Rana temporaria]